MTITNGAATRRRASRFALAIALLLALDPWPAEPAHADEATPAGDVGSGSLVARRPDGSALGPCPLTHTDVAAEISGFVARVVVTQTFANRFSEPVEAVYTFPLSDRAAVDGMTMRTGDRVIR